MEQTQQVKKTRTKKINPTSKYWLWTWNNYTEEIIEKIKNLPGDKIKYICFGKEVGEQGTPHLQGYIEIRNCDAGRHNDIKKILDPELGEKSPVHIGDEVGNCSFAKLRDFAIAYCKKGEQTKAEWKLLNTNGPTYGRNAVVYEKYYLTGNRQGARTDWEAIYMFIKDKPDFAEVMAEYPEYAIKYPNGIQKIINTVIQQRNIEAVNKQFDGMVLRPWQQALYNQLQGTPDPRKIIWYVDPKGNSGKSTMCDFLKVKMNALGVQNNKTSDVAHAYNGQNVVTFDFTKSMDGQINYSIIEAVKNGRVFSPKYDSVDKMFARPWVVCFSNFEPLRSAFIEDRWDIRRLGDEVTEDVNSIYTPPIDIPAISGVDNEPDDNIADVQPEGLPHKPGGNTDPTDLVLQAYDYNLSKELMFHLEMSSESDESDSDTALYGGHHRCKRKNSCQRCHYLGIDTVN